MADEAQVPNAPPIDLSKYDVAGMLGKGYSYEQIAKAVADQEGYDLDLGGMNKAGYSAKQFLASLHPPETEVTPEGTAKAAGSGAVEGLYSSPALAGTAARTVQSNPGTANSPLANNPITSWLSAIPSTKDFMGATHTDYQPQNTTEGYAKGMSSGLGGMASKSPVAMAIGAFMGLGGEGLTQMMSDPVTGQNDVWRPVGEAGVLASPLAMKLGGAHLAGKIASMIPFVRSATVQKMVEKAMAENPIRKAAVANGANPNDLTGLNALGDEKNNTMIDKLLSPVARGTAEPVENAISQQGVPGTQDRLIKALADTLSSLGFGGAMGYKRPSGL